MNSAVPADHGLKFKVSEKKDKNLNLARELKKKLWNMKVTVTLIVIGALGTVTKGLKKGLKNLEMTGRENQSYNIVEIGQNTEKRLVTLTPVKDHQLMVIRKTLSE